MSVGGPSDPSSSMEGINTPSSNPDSTSESSSMSEAQRMLMEDNSGWTSSLTANGKTVSWNNFSQMMQNKAEYLAKENPQLAPELKKAAGEMGKMYQNIQNQWFFNQYQQMANFQKEQEAQRKQTYGNS